MFSLNSEIYNFIYIYNHCKYLMLGYIKSYTNTFIIINIINKIYKKRNGILNFLVHYYEYVRDILA